MAKPYEFHPDAVERGEYAYIYKTGDETGLVVAGVEYVRRQLELGNDDIETVMLEQRDDKTVEDVIADLDRVLADTRGYLW